MKRYSIINMIIIIGVLFLLTENTYANKYDFIKTDPEIKNLVNVYETSIKPSPVLMNYLNAVIDSPTSLYLHLVDQDCEEDILKFVENNKSLALALIHIRLCLWLNVVKTTDAELIFVTNYINSPTALAATNGQEMGMEIQYMASLYNTFNFYQEFTKPGGFKTQIEDIFHVSLKNHNK